MKHRLEKWIARGRSPTLEFKRSTGELREAMQTLCAFANGDGGRVIFGVSSRGEILGQQVSEQTLHEIAACKGRFEPALEFRVLVIEVGSGRSVVVLRVHGGASRPYTYDGRAFERVAISTRRMALERLDELLQQRVSRRLLWEEEHDPRLSLADLSRGEVRRIVDLAREAGRLAGPVKKIGREILARFNVLRDGQLLRGAMVLFGKPLSAIYPQCELRMARFRGTNKNEFLDQKVARGAALHLLEEAELFCHRHFPLPGHFEPDRWQRQDRPLIPPAAMREILVNALIHRDYSIAGASIHLALFDDRVEVWSPGRFPAGITPQALTAEHGSVRRNPAISEAIYRAGLIEKWGRGTNRVIEMCAAHGIPAPEFREVGEAVVVTFRVPVAGAWLEMAVREGSTARYGVEPERDPLEALLLYELRNGPLTFDELARQLGEGCPVERLRRVVSELVERDRLEPLPAEGNGSASPRYRRISPAELRPFKPRPAR
ncbi:MAG: putative DNA binding domain-containing protein [Planctomycetes bacterium]|nr:putative DNA binding domain-containing protein [Planctomycetota bacterium]